MLAKGRDGAMAVSLPDTTGPTCPGPSSQCREQQWLLGRGREGELGKPGTLGVRGVGSQGHVLEKWQKTEGCVNGGSKPPAHALLSHWIHSQNIHLKIKLLKTSRELNPKGRAPQAVGPVGRHWSHSSESGPAFCYDY